MTEGAIYPSLAGRHVLITGGASGIGEAFVAAFASQKAKVTFLDIALDAGRNLQSRLSADTAFIECDLADIDALESSVAKARMLNGNIDVLINNAANDDRHNIEEVSPEYWDNRIAVNLRHQFFAARAVAADMRESGRGSIINLGSISWHVGLGGMSVYVTSKAAITGMTRALARELGGDRIRVNCIVPGAVRTERQVEHWLTPDAEKEIMDGQCLKKSIFPQHVASMGLFLASDDSLMCTGREYFVDAGWL